MQQQEYKCIVIIVMATRESLQSQNCHAHFETPH